MTCGDEGQGSTGDSRKGDYQAMAGRRDRLAQRRKAVGFSQERLAEHLRIDRTTVGRWENGESEPQPWTRPKLAQALGVSIDQLAGLLTTAETDDEPDQSSIDPDAEAIAADGAPEIEATTGPVEPIPALTLSLDGTPPEPGPDTVVLRLRLDSRDVVVPLSRRLLLQAGVGSFMEAFALGQQFDMLHDLAQQPRLTERLTITSPAHLEQILIHLREQWHALVKTDNLLGPRFALAGVLNQVSVVEALRSVLRDGQRLEAVRLGAQYAESAAWLYEDAGNMAQARYWTSRAMEWAYEGDDERMLAWTFFRRSQQAAATPDAAHAIGLAQAARRNEERLATPTRAAIRVQEAYGHALDGDEQASQRLLDEAHTWAASDTIGDAHEGHGSYCTPGHIEIQRASCWLTTGKPKKAIRLYEDALRTLPPVYQRNRAAALSRLAMAYLADGQIDQAASTAHAALPVARSSGAKRIFEEIKGVSAQLTPHRPMQPVAALLDDLRREDA
ncbi:helix-turn-helix domain-containing protein [Phytohabitans sp. ZYX-F-186]|uniref:Helix-turn-helix domain-containing protein n=1 Tax=Phytohabitans maris TaxID=3071409 RepID=A0ABU0ZFX2_9ACTN|nr:helix-turn-helix domain-containing protein [Phytohabitans sp. ZYX-F-186]MDQ7905958.1 helix-turn-helix domain-containing protein [Phytohabitans sp. ZYX-F-186]